MKRYIASMFAAAHMGLAVPAYAGEVSANAFHISGLHAFGAYEIRVILTSKGRYLTTLHCTGDEALEVSRLIKIGSTVVLDDKKIENSGCLDKIISVDETPIDQKQFKQN